MGISKQYFGSRQLPGGSAARRARPRDTLTPPVVRILLLGLIGLSCLSPRAFAAAPTSLAGVQELLRAGKFSDAERAARTLLRETEQTHGPESLEVADVLDQLSEAMRRGGKGGDPETRRICERSLEIRGKALGQDDPAYAKSLYQLGFLLYVNGDYAGAKPILERSLAIREAKLGPNHPDVMASLIPLGGLVSDMGDQTLAESMFQRVLRVRQADFGPDSPEAAECIEAIATIRFRAGDFAGSIPMHEQALRIRERALGPDHEKVATCLNNLAGALAETGDYDGALARGQRALQIRMKTLGPNHEYVATSLLNCGNYSAARGQMAQARRFYDSALAIWETRFGAGSPDVGLVLTRIALLYLQQGRFHEARPYLDRATANLERGLGPDHPDLADPLAALAATSAAEGDTALAWRSYERAIAIREKSLGPAHPDVGLVQTQYARALAACGQYAAALEHALQGEEISREHLRLTTRSLAERQALDYAAARPAGARVATSALLGIPGAPPETVERVWGSIIRARTLVLDEMAFRNHAVAEEGDSEAVRLNAELMAGRRRLANLLVAGPGGDPPERYRVTVDRAREETERIERALAARSSSFRSEEVRSRIGFRDVTSSLPPGCALVAYTTAGDSSSLAYLAFVLSDSGAVPVAVRIGSVTKIDAAVYKWLADVSASGLVGGVGPGGERASRASGAALRRAIWDPVAVYLSGARRVFIVPEGTINLVSFAAFPIGSTAYLLETGREFHYLSAERDIVPDSTRGPRGVGLLALGDADFDTRQGRRVPASAGSEPGGSAHAARGAEPASPKNPEPCVNLASIRFGALPQSGREAREVAAIWGDSSGTVLLTGARATEPAFESSAPGRRVLHIATHGFFLGGECQEASPTSRGIGGVSQGVKRGKAASREGSPLLLSGLAFAGANVRASAKPGEEDGVLTAEEIATLDLSGVEWAVLSACDTGKGRIRAGEGVQGLRRAFQVAGASTVIMSLWAVEDESARDWMKTLYQGRVRDGLDTADAVARASLRVLRERRAQARSTDPFYWAAFVAAGDWK